MHVTTPVAHEQPQLQQQQQHQPPTSCMLTRGPTAASPVGTAMQMGLVPKTAVFPPAGATNSGDWASTIPMRPAFAERRKDRR